MSNKKNNNQDKSANSEQTAAYINSDSQNDNISTEFNISQDELMSNIDQIFQSSNPEDIANMQNLLKLYSNGSQQLSKNNLKSRKANKQIIEQKRKRILLNKQKKEQKNKPNITVDLDEVKSAEETTDIKQAKKRKLQVAQGGLKYYNAVTPCTRHRVSIDRSTLYNGGALSPLTSHLKKTGYRNQNGRRTVTGRSDRLSHKKRYRFIDFSRRFFDNIEGIVTRIEYDPNRSAFIALIAYEDHKLSQQQLSNIPEYAYHNKQDQKIYSYIIAPKSLAVNDKIYSQNDYQLYFDKGSCASLISLPVGSVVHNIELVANGNKFLCRSAGCHASVSVKEKDYVTIRLPSGEQRKFPGNNRATLGVVSNEQHKHVQHGSAGKKRYLGFSSTTRGVAKNPVAHHNGGRTHGGKLLCNARGHMRKGLKTRSKNKQSNSLIISRRKHKIRKSK